MSDARADLSHRLALTVFEAAEAIGVSERHLRARLREIPHVHVGRRVIIPVEPFRRWLEEEAKTARTRVDTMVGEVLESLGERSE